jgi:aminopeptidase N
VTFNGVITILFLLFKDYMKQFLNVFYLFLVILLYNVNAAAQSGGPISYEQAAYDVKYYDLALNINPSAKTINGSLLCTVEIINTLSRLVLDLDNPFTVDSVRFRKGEGTFVTAAFTHSAGKLNIIFPVVVDIGDIVSAKIFYKGAPRIAVSPPWGSGFVWSITPTGKPWLAVTCQDEGADVWWPCKDHPSDKPDSMSLSLTVPNPLICVSNGRFLGSNDNGNNTSTFNWFISTPINNYNVTFYAAEYSLIEDTYSGVNGELIPFYFWVLPGSYNTALNYMNIFKNEFNFLESICGPFPFGTDKHGWAHSPYWGMEHQTVIAYGHNFTLNSYGFDYIHYHELAHEWWGNHITARDWSDIWIHEGIATYTEALYVEYLHGKEKYFSFMNTKHPANNTLYPLAPRQSMTAQAAFNNLNAYNRGASVMHSLRFHLGDIAFFNLLKRWAYPDSTDYNNTNGRLSRILSTDDMRIQAEEVTGRDLNKFFEVFFREKTFPVLNVYRGPHKTDFAWQTESNVHLDVSIPVKVNGTSQLIEMIDGSGSAPVSKDDTLVVDPDRWILKTVKTYIVSSAEDEVLVLDYVLDQNYPNPFNPNTTISFSIPEAQQVKIIVYDLLGNIVALPLDEIKPAGHHSVNFNALGLSSGTYFYELKTDNIRKIRKMILLK